MMEAISKIGCVKNLKIGIQGKAKKEKGSTIQTLCTICIPPRPANVQHQCLTVHRTSSSPLYALCRDLKS